MHEFPSVFSSCVVTHVQACTIDNVDLSGTFMFREYSVFGDQCFRTHAAVPGDRITSVQKEECAGDQLGEQLVTAQKSKRYFTLSLYCYYCRSAAVASVYYGIFI